MLWSLLSVQRLGQDQSVNRGTVSTCIISRPARSLCESCLEVKCQRRRIVLGHFKKGRRSATRSGRRLEHGKASLGQTNAAMIGVGGQGQHFGLTGNHPTQNEGPGIACSKDKAAL